MGFGAYGVGPSGFLELGIFIINRRINLGKKLCDLPTMYSLNGISRNAQSESYTLSLADYAWKL